MRNKQFLFFWILIVSIISCTKDDTKIPDSEITGLTEDVFFEQVGAIDSIGLREHYELLVEEYSSMNSDDEYTEDEIKHILGFAQEQIAEIKEYEDSCINVAGANWETGQDGGSGKNRLLGYQFTTIRYKSIDENGDPITLSSLVVWPYNNILSDPDANNVIIGCHITITKDSERPTNYKKNSIKTDVGMLACAAKSNGVTSAYENLVIIPDYQGYGVSRDRVHPYLSQNLTARQVLDGVNAGIAFYKSLKHKFGSSYKLEKNWRSISMGYSQGGSVALAVHRYIEKNGLVDKFKFAGSVCGDGPYDPVATVQKYITTNKVYMPVAVALIVKGMCDTSPALKGKYGPEDFLTEKFINTDIIKLISDKNKSTKSIQKHLLNYSKKYTSSQKNEYFIMFQEYSFLIQEEDKLFFDTYTSDHEFRWSDLGDPKTSYAETTDIFKDDVIKYFKGEVVEGSKEKMEALAKALNENILYNGWTPSHPTFLIHSQGDEVVPIDNYNACLAAWPGHSKVKGVRYKGITQTHVSFGSYFYMFHSTMGSIAIFSNTTNLHMFDRTDKGV